MTHHLSTITAALLVATAFAFVLYFAREYNWRRTPMGQSLMVMAVGMVVLGTAGLLYQLFGPDYWGRELVVIGGRVLVIGAFWQRMYALYVSRRQIIDRR